MCLFLVCRVLVLRSSELLLLEPDADEGQHEQEKTLSRNEPSGERMAMARTEVGWMMSASTSTLKTRSLSGGVVTLRYDDSSTTNGLLVEIFWKTSREKLSATAMG